MLQGRKVLTMNVRAEESNLNSNVDRWEGRIAGRTITHFLTLKTMQGGGNTQNRSFRKIIILIHPSWLMLFMLFWALQAEKFYLSQRLTRSMGVNIAVQGNLWQFFNSAMHLQIFELCCPAFGIFPPYLKKWICLCTQRKVAIKDDHGCSPEGCGIWEIQLRDALQSVSSLMQYKSQVQTATHILQAKLWGVAHSWKKNVWNGRAEALQLFRFPCLEINLNLSILRKI